jgi:hypothetical protein
LNTTQLLALIAAKLNPRLGQVYQGHQGCTMLIDALAWPIDA